MEDQWYLPISDELATVDGIIADTIRSKKPELQEMCDYVTSSGGKRIRPALCILAYYACGGTESDEMLRTASAFELIHDATLIHDDINDKSEIRRGRKTVHENFTVTKAVILGDYFFVMGLKLISMDKNIVETIADASKAIAESEFIQKEFEHKPIVTESDYLNIIRGKTAMLMSAAARVGAYLANADHKTTEAISAFALDAGMAFQMIDDVLDVIGDYRSTGKKAGMDIAEGKPTLPVIYAMSDSANGKRIREIFEKRESTDADLETVLEMIRKTDAIDRCMAKAKEMIEIAISHLSSIKDTVYKDSLTGLARYIVSRDR
ncbi:MAG: polyprenyl synthetase family protein [Methanomassiliicoccaceae archaeon]|nr:polyprenyl synthetase family protein [Methanomassiliicoccaceae archaeon]